MIRVLVVEDSKTVQRLLVSALSADPELTVVGTAETGEAAVEATRVLRPDLITMDLNLPGMDGFEATRAIMSSCPVPIVIVSGKVDPKDSATLFRVMEAGALLVQAKPAYGSPGYDESMASLIRHVKLMSEIKVVRRTFPRGTPTVEPPAALPLPSPAAEVQVVAIGASTGGPPLLRQMLAELAADFPAAVLVVQHMAEGFTENFVHWLDQGTRLPVLLAGHGMAISPGHAYVAPDGKHMEVTAGDRIALVDTPPEKGVRPSISVLFRSVARYYGRKAAGVLLTGMGTDGAAGLRVMKDCGGVTIVQNAESAVVFGMPGEAVRLDAARYVLPPDEITQLLAKMAGAARASR